MLPALEERLAFPLELDGAVRMSVAEGVRRLSAQEFEARKGTEFKAGGMEFTVEEAMGHGKEFSRMKLGFKDRMNVKEIIRTEDQSGAPWKSAFLTSLLSFQNTIR